MLSRIHCSLITILHAISKHIEIINFSLNEKSNELCVFLDHRKTLDAAKYAILFNKLYQYGVEGVLLALIADYLRDRMQCVRLGNISSAFRTVNIGAPQGSILGPLLFLYYINDLNNVSYLLSCVLFSYYTTLYASGNDTSLLIDMFHDELLCISR